MAETAPEKTAASRKTRGLLLKELTFKQEHRCFARGSKLTFRPGVNLLVGDQGAGKSTVIDLIRGLGAQHEFERDRVKELIEVHTEQCRLAHFDFERDNPRTLGHFMDGGGIRMQISSKFISHGQTTNTLLEGICKRLEDSAGKRPKTLLLLDEPDMALSPRSARQLAWFLDRIAKAGHQVLAAVHNPLVIASQPEVCSLEHRRWMTPQAFLVAHEQQAS